MIAPLGFHHVALRCQDVERVAAFYREVLGLPELTRWHHPDGRLRSIWVSASGAGGPGAGFFAVEHGEPFADRGAVGFTMVALTIAAEARALVREALLARGLRIERETAFTLYIRDPEGNLVGLSHHPHASPAPATPR